jgi:hypothetical protein
VVSRVVQDLQVVLGAEPFVAAVAEPVVGQAEPRRREQVIAVGVVGERPRLPHERIDDVPVVDRVPVAADQPRQRVDVPVRVPHLDPVGEQAGLDGLADQPAVDRVGVAVDVDQAAGVDPARHLQARRQPLLGQGPQRPHLLGEPVGAARVPRRHDLPEEGRVLVPVGERAAPPQQQRLIDGRLEVPVRRLRVPVLVGLPDVDPLARQAVVRQQVAVTGPELPRRRQVVHGRTQAVAAVPPGHPAQFPQRVLQPVRQGLERLRRADRDRFPVRVRQHEVVHQVVEPPAGHGDVQGVHAREIRRGQVAGRVDLAEHDGLARTVGRPPLPHAALEGAAVGVEELARVFPPQPVEEGLGPQPRLGAQPLGDGGPDGRERVGPGAVGPGWLRLLAGAGQGGVIAVVSGRLVGHACSPGRRGQGDTGSKVAQEPTHLAVRNHRTPPKLRESRSWPAGQKEGILIVAEEGKLIDATHELILLMSSVQFAALEAAAVRRKLTAAQMTRRVLADFLGDPGSP